jgi:hypothetical protein
MLPDDISSYKLRTQPQNLNAAINMWASQAGSPIESKTGIEDWVKFINGQIETRGASYLQDETAQKASLDGKTLDEFIADIYDLNMFNGDNFKMYGNSYFTLNHAKSDLGYPDLIYLRPQWYMTYVKNLAWLLAVKFDKPKLSFSDVMLFDGMVKYAQDQRCSLKGIIDYQVAKKLGQSEFYIPVFYYYKYSKKDAPTPGAWLDATLVTDYPEVAKEVLRNTKRYLDMQGVRYKISEVPVRRIINKNDIVTQTGKFLLAYKVTILN